MNCIYFTSVYVSLLSKLQTNKSFKVMVFLFSFWCLFEMQIVCFMDVIISFSNMSPQLSRLSRAEIIISECNPN